MLPSAVWFSRQTGKETILSKYIYSALHVYSVTQLGPTLCNPMDCSLPGSSVLGIFQARILELVAFSYSRKSSQPRDQACVSCIFCTGWQILYHCTIWEALDRSLLKPNYLYINKATQSFPSGSVVNNPPANAGDMGSVPWSGSSPGEGNGNPLQYPCLGNPKGRRARQAPVHGVAQLSN